MPIPPKRRRLEVVRPIDTWDLVLRRKGGRMSIFRFKHHPSLQEFLSVCSQLPWTSVWDDGFLAALKKSQWPAVEAGYKTNSSVVTWSCEEMEVTIEKSTLWYNG